MEQMCPLAYAISTILSAACFNRIVEFGAVPSSPRGGYLPRLDNSDRKPHTHEIPGKRLGKMLSVWGQ